MSIKKQFSQHAYEYNNFNIIQQIAAKALVRDIKTEPKKILEIGCGSGQVFKYIDWNFDSYTAVDFSQSMCELHPKGKNIDVHCFDFDSMEFRNFLDTNSFDMVISSSALQWSKDLSKLLAYISTCSNQMIATLFTSNTFKTIHKLSNKNSPILSQKEIEDAFSMHFNCEFEIYNYNLEFNNKRDLFDYIKKSGVSGESNLDFSVAKKLYKNYNLSYLEFEVIFVKCFSRL